MMGDNWSRSLEAFDQAVMWFKRTLPVGKGHWDEMALGEWTVRDLAGHTSRAMLTVEVYLGNRAQLADIFSPVDYFNRILGSSGDSAAIAQRGREAGVALGVDPASSVNVIVERVLKQVRAERGDALLTTPVGGMRLMDYLPTRTFELTVHTCDLVVALGLTLDVPEAAAAETLQLVSGLASRPMLAGPLLLAATGRRSLPPGFSVLV